MESVHPYPPGTFAYPRSAGLHLASSRPPSLGGQQPSTTTGPWEAGAQPLADTLIQRRLSSRSTRVTASQPSQAQSGMAASLTAPLQFCWPTPPARPGLANDSDLLLPLSPSHTTPQTPESPGGDVAPFVKTPRPRMRPRSWTLTLHRPSRGGPAFELSTCPAGTTRRRTPPAPLSPPRGRAKLRGLLPFRGVSQKIRWHVHMAVNAIEWMSHHGPVAATTLAASLEPWGKIQMTLAPPPADLPSMVNLLPTHVHPSAVIMSTFFE